MAAHESAGMDQFDASVEGDLDTCRRVLRNRRTGAYPRVHPHVYPTTLETATATARNDSVFPLRSNQTSRTLTQNLLHYRSPYGRQHPRSDCRPLRQCTQLVIARASVRT